MRSHIIWTISPVRQRFLTAAQLLVYNILFVKLLACKLFHSGLQKHHSTEKALVKVINGLPPALGCAYNSIWVLFNSSTAFGSIDYLQCLAKVFTPQLFFLFWFIATCNYNGFLAVCTVRFIQHSYHKLKTIL